MKAIINQTVSKMQKEALSLTEADFAAADIELLLKIKVEMSLIIDVQQFRSERLAYDWAEQTTKELLALFPAYYQKNPIDSQRRTDAQIIEGYRMESNVVGKYLRGLCDEVT